ncbi:hypothetical protein AAKBPDAN_00063 [Escherichia phage vB_EcoS-phiEc4]|nr:hypothetical protein AAKBPDAN_00063 [Escherichia phage vB_EcoS-phiEc4]
MAQRYENDHGDMFQVAEGNWVRYEDYAELERKLRNFADQVLYAPCSKVTEETAREILDL